MSLKVVIIDDEVNMTKILEKILVGEGYIVNAFNNPVEAIGFIREDPPDVVLSDFRMPEMNGQEVLDEIKAIDDSIQVIILTAYGTIDSAVSAMKAGAFHYITKPFQTDVLLMTIAKSLEYRELALDKEVLERKMAADEAASQIVGETEKINEIRDLISKAAPSNSTVLIRGESGTGKELVARALHYGSQRKKNRFFSINCAGIPESLLESEMFGHEKGAFTGAYQMKPGIFEVAQGGTLFLDEIGEMPAALQAKLLRVLQEKKIQRVGGIKEIQVDVRVLAATNKDLEKAIEENAFRQDLYYRLNVISIFVPSLRERLGDVELLVNYFIKKYKTELAKPELAIEMDVIEKLKEYHWPGNIRELENIIERMSVLTTGNVISMNALPLEINMPSTDDIGGKMRISNYDYRSAKADFEMNYLKQLLEKAGGNISEAAKLAGFSRRNIYEKINQLGIDPAEFK